MDKNVADVLKVILSLTLPFLKELVLSKVVPAIKRKAYAATDAKINALIEDLVQNASKIADEENEAKKLAYIEGTRLGIETIRALANKLNKAADEIEKVL